MSYSFPMQQLPSQIKGNLKMLDALQRHIRHVLDLVLIELPSDCAEEIKAILHAQGVNFTVLNNSIELLREDTEKVTAVIQKCLTPNLLPAQFYWLLAKSGLEPATATLLTQLQTTDPDKYAAYKAFLYGARYYEFNKSLDMLNQAKPVIEQAYPDLDLSVPVLKTLWLQAAKF